MPRPLPVPRTPRRAARSAAALALGLAGSACAAPPPPPPVPALDAERVALLLEVATRLEEPARVLFEWSVSETDLRVGGRGVARVEAPYHARLDLFLGSGETVVRAALVEDDLRLPAGAPEGLIPPPDLLWGALGVFRPGREAALLGGESLPDGRTRLRYRTADGLDIRYTVGAGRVHEVERLRDGAAVERLTLTWSGEERFPAEATYRNLAEFRELRLTRGAVERVEPYPPDIWWPGR